MLSRWPIRYKLLLCVVLLLCAVAILSFSSFRGVYAYRQLARSISRRATELPLADDLTRSVGELRATVNSLHSIQHRWESGYQPVIEREQFRIDLLRVKTALKRYSEQLERPDVGDPLIADNRREWETVGEIRASLERVSAQNLDQDWVLNELNIGMMQEELEMLTKLTGALPTHLQGRMHEFAGQVRGQYRTWIVLTWVTTVLAVGILGALAACFYLWVFHPLRILIHGSRYVARGAFEHRIRLPNRDEMGELAGAMNDMTDRFCEIRDSLNREVQMRTQEVVRSEQLASVGFLAAGVAHEINNPLASIAWCAESLESRVHDIILEDDAKPDAQHNQEISVLRNYLRKIQDEAFRCKGITERLLDFSRLGDVEHLDTDMRELVEGVIEMVQHLGSYRDKHIQFSGSPRVMAQVNSQEIKQVVLNLITNALDNMDPGGTVHIELQAVGQLAELVVLDDGCGMSEETLRHLFEPFFTRRRDGKGTGLGLSITYRIVADHGGQIEAFSEGPGQGSRFRVTLPLVHHEEKQQKEKQAA